MAFAFVKEVAHGGEDTAFNGTDNATYAIPVLSAPAAGDAVVLSWSARDDGGTIPVPTVTDSKGNTWTVKYAINNHPANRIISLVAFTDQAAGKLTTSDTITVRTNTTALWESVVWTVEEFSFPAGRTLALDVFATATGNAATSFPTGTTAATAAAAELALANCATGFQLTTKDAGYTAPTTGAQDKRLANLTANGIGGFGTYKILAATGTQSATYTGSSSDYAGVIVVLRALLLITPTFAGTSSLAPTVTPYKQFSPTLTGTSTLTAALTPYQRFGPTLTGTSTLDVAVTPYRRFSATLTGTSTLDVALTPYQRITVTLTGTSTLTAALTELRYLVVDVISGASSLSFDVATMPPLLATLAGTASLDVRYRMLRYLAATLSGASSLDAAAVGYALVLATITGRCSVGLAYLARVIGGKPVAGFIVAGSSGTIRGEVAGRIPDEIAGVIADERAGVLAAPAAGVIT